jgi:hypothetical protein
MTGATYRGVDALRKLLDDIQDTVGYMPEVQEAVDLKGYVLIVLRTLGMRTTFPTEPASGKAEEHGALLPHRHAALRAASGRRSPRSRGAAGAAFAGANCLRRVRPAFGGARG